MRKTSNMRGFTLVEVLFAITIGLMLLGALFVAVQSGQKSSVAIEGKTAAQQDVRAALDVMAVEIGMTSYNPKFVSNASLWVDLSSFAGQGCNVLTSAPTNPTWKGIKEATAFSLTVEADINGDATMGSSGEPNEVIRYVYVNTGGNQYITRCSCCSNGQTGSGGQPFLGDTVASGRPRVVRVVNDVNNNGAYDDGTDIPVFRYYDGNGAQIPYASLPARIPDIRRIEITLAVDTADIDPNTGQRRRMIYSTSAILRNHAISP